MYITELKVIGFGLHIEKTVTFKPGVNVIVGESEAGKTTLIRALYLAIENSPRGGEKLYQSDDTDELLYIRIKDNLGNVIIRTKNKYYLNDGKPMKAFGSSVPTPIKEILNFKDINWQRQISEKPFLLFNTGGSAAKDLNKVTGLQDQEVIIIAIKEGISDRKTNIKRLIKNNEEHKQTIERLKNVVRFKMKCQGIINQKQDSDKLKGEIYNLTGILDELKIVRRNEMLNQNIIDKFSVQVGKIVKGKGVIKVYDDHINELGNLVVQLERIPQFDHKIIKDHGTTLQKVAVLNRNSEEINDNIEQLYSIIKKIEGLKSLYRKADKEVSEINKELNSIFSEIGYCPLCNQAIEGDHEC
jgi:DNA repair exonuclease SbcCD ATPase subunit